MPTVTIDEIIRSWTKVLTQLQKTAKPEIVALLRLGRPEMIDGPLLYVRFPSRKEADRWANSSSDEGLIAAQTALKTVVGLTLRVQALAPDEPEKEEQST